MRIIICACNCIINILIIY